MTDKRFINDIDNGKLIDTKGELSTIYYSDSVDFYELWEFLNKLNDENEQLKQYKKAIWDWDSSKIIRVNMNTGEVDLVDKELEE